MLKLSILHTVRPMFSVYCSNQMNSTNYISITYKLYLLYIIDINNGASAD